MFSFIFLIVVNDNIKLISGAPPRVRCQLLHSLVYTARSQMTPRKKLLFGMVQRGWKAKSYYREKLKTCRRNLNGLKEFLGGSVLNSNSLQHKHFSVPSCAIKERRC